MAYDLSKLFVDPHSYDPTDKGSALENELLTEIIVTGLPRDFFIERALENCADTILKHYPDLPNCAWAMNAPALGPLYFILAFEHPVEIVHICHVISEAVENEIARCGASLQEPYWMSYDTAYQYPRIAEYVDNQNRNGPSPGP